MSTPRYAVTVRMDAEDFTTLVQDGGPLAGIPPENRGRLLDEGEALEREWRYIYWLGGEYIAVLFARSYLEAIGEDYQVVYDEAMWDSGRALGWAVLTDYQDEGRP